MATISEMLGGNIPCSTRVLHALDDTNDLCAPHMEANSPAMMRELKKATSLTLTIGEITTSRSPLTAP